MNWWRLAAGLLVMGVGMQACLADGDAPSLGTAAVDFVVLKSATVSVPLRHGAVVRGSEQVTLNGVPLRVTQDYSLDAQTGVVYLLRATHYGDTLFVNYRYDDRAVATAPATGAALLGTRLNFAGNALQLSFGLGMAERTSDGSVLNTHLLGLGTNFTHGKTSLKGGVVVSQSEALESRSAYDYQAASSTAGKRAATYVNESLQFGVAGGSAQIDYQNIGSKFTGYSALAGQGLTADQISQYQKEAGLRRMGFALSDVHLGGLTMSERFRTVKDNSGELSWTDLGFKTGGLSLQYSGRDLGSGFQRYGDLAEQDRASLQREAGIGRRKMTADYQAGFGKLSFSTQHIATATGAIDRLEYGFDTKMVQVQGGVQDVGANFSRFGALEEANRGQWAKEAGMKRDWLSLNMALLGQGSPQLSVKTLRFGANGSGFTSQDVAVTGKTWSLAHAGRLVDPTFGNLGSLAQDEINANAATIADMVGKPPNGADAGGFTLSSGLSRTLDRIKFEPGKGESLQVDSYRLRAPSGGAGITSLAFARPGLTANWRRQTLGPDLSQWSRYTVSEQQAFGTIMGLGRTDFALSMTGAKGRKMSVATMSAGTGTQTAGQTSLDYSDTRMALSAHSRSVTAGFTNVGQLTGVDAQALLAMLGNSESDVKLDYADKKRFQMSVFAQNGAALDATRLQQIRNYSLHFTPDARTTFEAVHYGAHDTSNASVLVNHDLNAYSWSRDLGRMGRLTLREQSQSYSGAETTTPGSHQEIVSYETNLTHATKLLTEDSDTRYDNGDHEMVTTRTVSTSFSKTVGASVSNVYVDRPGVASDETHRNYGLWMLIGNGLRLDYGAVRNLQGDQTGSGTSQNTVSIGQGQVGDFAVGGQYSANQWDGQRTQANGSVSVATAKPLKLGRFTDVKFNVSSLTSADRSMWIKQDRLFHLEGKYGAANLGYEFRSQVDPSTQNHGIDRGFWLVTDPGHTKPWRADLSYKLRVMPNGTQYIIRTYQLTARLNGRFDLSHQLQTNPEVANGSLILGSMVQPTNVDSWKLDFHRATNLTVSGSYDERIDSAAHTVNRVGGITLQFNEHTDSPFSVFLGTQTNSTQSSHMTATTYAVKWNPKATERQHFSFLLSTISYPHDVPGGNHRQNLTLAVDWLRRF